MTTLPKFFMPPGGSIESDEVVKLSDGTRLPAWAFIAVPIIDKVPTASVPSAGLRRKMYVDAVTGVISATAKSPVLNSMSGGFTSEFDFSEFSRSIDLTSLRNYLHDALPQLSLEVEDVVDSGYFDAPGAKPIVTVAVNTDDWDGHSTDYMVGKLRLREYLLRTKIPQSLEDSEESTRISVVSSLAFIANNIVDRAALFGDDRPFVIYSGYVSPGGYTPNPEAVLGQCVRIEFSDSTSQQIYLKAVSLAQGLAYDELYLDYRGTGTPIITFVLKAGSQRRKIFTRYDDKIVSTGRLLNLSRTINLSDTVADADEDLTGVYFNPDDDYTQIISMLQNAPDMFGGIKNVQSILQSIGLNANPFTGAPAAGQVGSTAVAGTVKNSLQQSIQCPDEKVDPKLFPTGSGPSQRRLTDVSQLDDSETQDNQSFPLRVNNPLKVKKIAGVTDLKTRFGYLGEANGIAVYRDHVGGAAAGMNYVMQTSGGKSMASATRSVMGTAMSGFGDANTSPSTDLTAPSAAKTFSTVSQHVFGVADPSGVTQQCATVKPDTMESMISYCAALSKSICGGETSPLTYDEWASAYQIAKNEPNEHLKKSTTGADLPVTEESNTIDTGVMTPSQAKDARNTTDYQKRANTETWNPTTNYPHYAEKWGANGSNWIAKGVTTYAQKSSNTDITKFAKAYETEQLNQNDKFKTPNTMLPWTPNTSSSFT